MGICRLVSVFYNDGVLAHRSIVLWYTRGRSTLVGAELFADEVVNYV